MLLRQIALVSDSPMVTFRQLAAVSAALQKQATRDFGPIWEVQATVDPFAALEDVPLGYWPIVVQDDIMDPGVAGIHEDRLGQPFALVKAGPLWSLTASHECLEMLADPFGNRTIAGYAPPLAPKTSKTKKKTAPSLTSRVEFLVEVCDPCEDVHNAYGVNGIPVSDFYTPEYLQPAAIPSVRYDYRGHIKAPFEVLLNGYLSWYDPTTETWSQLTNFGKPSIKELEAPNIGRKGFNLRSAIDRHTATPLEELTLDDADGTGTYFGSLLQSCCGDGTYFPPCIGPLLRNSLRTGKILAEVSAVHRFSKLVADGGGALGFDPDDTLISDARSLRESITQAKAGDA